jgi:hypothetical protein
MLEYNEFNLNRILESLVNESMFYYTKAFADILNKIGDNEIAEDLLSVKGTDVKPDMTFVDVDDKEGFISFSQISKAISGINKWMDEYVKDNDDVDVDSVMASRDKMISNIKDGTWNGNFTGDIYKKSRNTVKLGKLVNSIFPGKYTAKQVEEFVNKYKSKAIDEKKFELVEGAKIIHWYNSDNYKYEDASIGSSCMRYSRCRNYFGIYTENVGICKLLILKDNDNEDEILGRALVWKYSDISMDRTEIGNAEWYMDRVYVGKDIYYEDFREYAIANNWLYRASGGYGDSDVNYNSEGYGNVDIEVKLDYYEFDNYPYMDTFKRLDIDEGILYNDDDTDTRDCYILEDTHGGYQDTNGKWSSYYETTIPEDDAIYSEPLDTYIYNDNYVYIDTGHWKYHGNWPADHDDVVQDEYREEYIHRDDAIYCSYEDKTFFDEDAVDCITKFEGLNNYDEELFSNKEDNIVNIDRMDIESYLEDNDFDFNYFHTDLLRYSNFNDKYYLSEFEVDLFETSKGYYSIVDCDILGLKPSDKSYFTDEFSYNHILHNDNMIETLIEKANKKIKYYENTSQTRLVFDEEDEANYKAVIYGKIDSLKQRVEELESF